MIYSNQEIEMVNNAREQQRMITMNQGYYDATCGDSAWSLSKPKFEPGSIRRLWWIMGYKQGLPMAEGTTIH